MKHPRPTYMTDTEHERVKRLHEAGVGRPKANVIRDYSMVVRKIRRRKERAARKAATKKRREQHRADATKQG